MVTIFLCKRSNYFSEFNIFARQNCQDPLGHFIRVTKLPLPHLDRLADLSAPEVIFSGQHCHIFVHDIVASIDLMFPTAVRGLLV